MLKIQKRSVKMRKQTQRIPIPVWYSGCHSGVPWGVSVEAITLAHKTLPSGPGLQARGWGCILPQEPKGWLYITLLPIVYFFFWSQTTTLINGLTGLLFICSFLPGSLRSTLRAYFFLLEVEASLSLHFFSSEFISWYFSYTGNAISGFRWGITVTICGSSLPILWDWDITSKGSKLLLPLPWELFPFQTVAINY